MDYSPSFPVRIIVATFFAILANVVARTFPTVAFEILLFGTVFREVRSILKGRE